MFSYWVPILYESVKTIAVWLPINMERTTFLKYLCIYFTVQRVGNTKFYGSTFPNGNINPSSLAVSGLIYEGDDDRARCWYSGVPLMNYEKNDSCRDSPDGYAPVWICFTLLKLSNLRWTIGPLQDHNKIGLAFLKLLFVEATNNHYV